MKGAAEYAGLFKTGQHGQLYLASSHHARGTTFYIQILPKGEKAISNGSQNKCVNKDAVEVYGITGGNHGWTETYGWLHEGPWQQDFYDLVAQRKLEINKVKKERKKERNLKLKAEDKRIQSLLEKY